LASVFCILYSGTLEAKENGKKNVGRLLDGEVGLGEIRQSGPAVMGQAAHQLPGLVVVVRVTPERGRQAEVAAFVQGLNVLVHRVHRLQNATRYALELAQLAGLLRAVVLQIVGAIVGRDVRLVRQRNAIHVRELAQSRVRIVVGRSTGGSGCTEKNKGGNGEMTFFLAKEMWYLKNIKENPVILNG